MELIEDQHLRPTGSYTSSDTPCLGKRGRSIGSGEEFLGVVSEPVPVRFDVVDVDLKPGPGQLGGVAVAQRGAAIVVPGSDIVE